MRGFFGLGVEGISKPRNAGALFRTAHAFDASFVFAVAPAVNVREIHSTDTSASTNHLPLYEFGSIDEMVLPKGCRLVGIELTDDSIELPSFKHPDRCAYVLGPERGSLSSAMQERCDFIVKIPTKFCVNVSVAGAIVLYDRIISKGRWADRPVMSGGPKAPLEKHVHGPQIIRTKPTDK